METNKFELRNLVRGYRHEGKRVVGYGAPAKKYTSWIFRDGTEDIDYICDRSSLKQDALRQVHIFRLSTPNGYSKSNRIILCCSWNFVEEIFEQQSEYLARGGQFILPIPKVSVISK